MAQRTLIKGGTVISVDPGVGDFETGDVLIENGVIAAVGASLDAGDAEVIDATDRIVLPGPHRHPPAHLAGALPQHRLRLDARALLHRPARHDEPALPPRGHLRGQPDRHARGARRRHHDAARLVAQPQHAGALRRRDRGAPGDALARGLRARLRLRALGAGELAAARRGHPPGRAPVLLLGRPARHARHGAAREPVRDARGDRARLPARARARHPHHLPRRGRRMGQGAADRTAPGARAARRDADLRALQLAGRRRAEDDGGGRLHGLDLARHRAADGPRLAGHGTPAGRRHAPEPLDRRVLLQRRPPLRHHPGHDRHAARLRPGRGRRRPAGAGADLPRRARVRHDRGRARGGDGHARSAR